MSKKIAEIILSMGILFSSTIYAQTASTESLSQGQQAIVRFSALTAKGDLLKLKPALTAALEAGLTINQIKEALVHIYAYAGFPRSIRGLQTFMNVLEERKSRGVKDPEGRVSTPVSDNRSKYDRGKAILDTLLGSPQDATQTGYSAFAPQIEIFLKEHLFADIFERDALSYAERELVTVSVLSSIGGVEPMLQSHLKICLNLGFTADQLKQFGRVIGTTVGQKESQTVQDVLDGLLKTRK